MTYTVSNRQRGATYTFKVRAVNQLGASAWSDELTVESVTSLYPGAPQLAVSSVSARSFGLRWQMQDEPLSENVQEYWVYVTGDNATTHITLPAVSATDCVQPCYATIDVERFAALQPNTTYTLEMRAKNVYGPSVESNVVVVTTLAAPPELVGGLVVSNVTQSSLEVSWLAPAANGQPVTAYRVWACDVESGGCTGEELPS
eukprot:5893893-Prymnesium_polylepis.1